MRQLPLGVRIPDRAVFASFLPARNREVVESLQEPHRAGFTWLCGLPGSGKTHLLQAVSVQAGETVRAGYFPIAELAALGPGTLEGLAQLDCVCLDDIDKVAGQREWEQALFNLYRELEERAARCVMAAQVPPALTSWALPDLASRLSAGTVYQLRVLDEAEQREALKLRARLRGVGLPDDTARWLQRRFPRDMHSLYGLLDTLDEAALVAQRRLTVPFIRSVLKE